MKNIAYVGALSALIGLDMEIIQSLVESVFKSKQKLIPANFAALKIGVDYARENYDCNLGFKLEKMNESTSIIVLPSFWLLTLQLFRLS